jgi:RNA polymerase sigma-70 factor (ECF subfamily)
MKTASGAEMPHEMPEIPRELVARARDGDAAALERLVEAAYPRVRRWALVHTGEEAEADDLTQDVLIRMIRNLDGFQGDARFATWLYAVTRNAAVDRHRRGRRRTLVSEHASDEGALHPWRPEDPARATERRELGRLVRSYFAELPERQRAVFDLVELQGLSASEAAEVMDIEPVSVRAHLFKARRTMRARMLEEHPELAEGAT